MQKLSYEICKRLKDAGFPLIEMNATESMSEQLEWCKVDFGGEWFYIPTLSELIEECGDRFYSLTYKKLSNLWEAESIKGKKEGGNIPEEAVANLYLEINKK